MDLRTPILLACSIIFASLDPGSARAELVPEDPYADLDVKPAAATPAAAKPAAVDVKPDAVSAATWFASTIAPAPAVEPAKPADTNPADAKPAIASPASSPAPQVAVAPPASPSTARTDDHATGPSAPGVQDVDATESVLHRGHVAFESGPLPAPLDSDPLLAGVRAGYVCDATGVFWSYFELENCRPAAIHGNSFDDSSPQLAAKIRALYPEPEIPFWAEHGWKIMAPAALLLAVAWIVRRRRTAVRRRKQLEDRKTQFGMSTVDPAIAEELRAAWEHAPPIVPTAVVSLIMRPSDRLLRLAAGSSPPPIANPQPAAALPSPSPMPATGGYAHLAPFMPYALDPAYAPASTGPNPAFVPASTGPNPAFVPASTGPNPAYAPARPPHDPYGPPAMPPPIRPSIMSAQPVTYQVAIAPSVMPYAAPNAPTQHMPQVASVDEIPYGSAISAGVQPASYPLTFPAFPEQPEPTHENAPRTPGVWEASRVIEDGPTAHDPRFHRGQQQAPQQAPQQQDYAIQFARGSQPDEALAQAAQAARLVMPSPAPAPRTTPRYSAQPRPSAVTIRSHGPKRS